MDIGATRAAGGGGGGGSNYVDPGASGTLVEDGNCSGDGSVTITFGAPVPSPGATPPQPGALNHFQCYDVHNTSTAPIGTVTVIDEFRPASGFALLTLDLPKRLCNPADKLVCVGGANINANCTVDSECPSSACGDPTAPTDPDHLVGYKVRGRTPAFSPQTGLTATDQFATLTFAVVKPDFLLVPSAKTITPATPVPGSYVPAIDHYTCYRMVNVRHRESNVSVVDEFGTLPLDLKRPLHYCVPTSKNGSTIIDAASHLTCYQVHRRRGSNFHPPFAVAIDNQFGPDSLNSFRPTELCLPSQAGNVPATPTPTLTPTPTDTATPTPSATATPACGNGVPDPGEACDGESFCGPHCQLGCVFATSLGQCIGSDCPDGQVCSVIGLPGCGCVPGNTSCGFAHDFPSCGGACAQGDVCGAITIQGTDLCSCVSQAATCNPEGNTCGGGKCPNAGDVCEIVGLGSSCSCTTP
jgi:hypothetical protein